MTEGRKSSGFSVDSNVFLTIVRGGFRLRKPESRGRGGGRWVQSTSHSCSVFSTVTCVCVRRLTSDRQSGASGDKLQEQSLLLGIEAAQHFEQEAYGATVGRQKVPS